MRKPNTGLDFTPHTDRVIPHVRNPQIGVIHYYTAKRRSMILCVSQKLQNQLT